MTAPSWLASIRPLLTAHGFHLHRVQRRWLLGPAAAVEFRRDRFRLVIHRHGERFIVERGAVGHARVRMPSADPITAAALPAAVTAVFARDSWTGPIPGEAT